MFHNLHPQSSSCGCLAPSQHWCWPFPAPPDTGTLESFRKAPLQRALAPESTPCLSPRGPATGPDLGLLSPHPLRLTHQFRLSSGWWIDDCQLRRWSSDGVRTSPAHHSSRPDCPRTAAIIYPRFPGHPFLLQHSHFLITFDKITTFCCWPVPSFEYRGTAVS